MPYDVISILRKFFAPENSVLVNAHHDSISEASTQIMHDSIDTLALCLGNYRDSLHCLDLV